MSEPILQIHGEVDSPGQLSRADLAAIAAEFQVGDVSKHVPSRKGTAVRLEGLLKSVGVRPTAKYMTLHASADDFHASIPLESVCQAGLVVYQLDGEDLPLAAGGPIRFLIPDVAQCHSQEVDECANVKFIDRMEFTQQRGYDNRPEDDQEHEELHRREKESK